ncbi:MAG: hypothetical protein WC595_05905 [Candidatus Nanoarchaeia archaeon]
MKTLIEIFGKEKNIKIEEVEEKLIKNKYKESQIFDAKAIKTIEEDFKESHLIKPVISFLNSKEGRGLLCLGVSTGGKRNNICEKIVPIKAEVIVNGERLRALISDNVGTIPVVHDNFSMNIEVVSDQTMGNIFLVEVEIKDRNCVYYSKISDYVYVRNNDESKKLTLPEEIVFINEKIVPRIILYADQMKEQEEGVRFNLAYRNEGLKPGKQVSTIIVIHSSNKELKPTIKGMGVSSLSGLNIGEYESFQINLPSTSLIYPKLPTFFAHLFIPTKNDFKCYIQAEIYESSGKTIQEILISYENKKEKIEELKRDFISYLSMN